MKIQHFDQLRSFKLKTLNLKYSSPLKCANYGLRKEGASYLDFDKDIQKNDISK